MMAEDRKTLAISNKTLPAVLRRFGEGRRGFPGTTACSTARRDRAVPCKLLLVEQPARAENSHDEVKNRRYRTCDRGFARLGPGLSPWLWPWREHGPVRRGSRTRATRLLERSARSPVRFSCTAISRG